MITAKIALDTRYKSKTNLYPIVIRVRNGNQLRHVQTEHKIPKAAWNKTEVKKNYPGASSINADIANKLATVQTKIAEAIRLKVTDLDAIVKGEHEPAKMTFSEYVQIRAKHYYEAKKLKHVSRITHYLANLQECFGEKPPAYYTDAQRKDYYNKVSIPFELTMDDMRTFFTFLKSRNEINTVAFKFSKLAQLFNNAIKEKRTDAENVFEQYKVPTKPVHKEKLSKAEIEAIEALHIPPGTTNNVRNLFLFAYYCKGMRFEDCIRFKTKNIVKDRLIFPEIRKGYKRITVQLHPKLKQLIEPYLKNEPYLFPFLSEELARDKGIDTIAAEEERISKVESQNGIVNRHLKAIVAAAGIDKKIGFHNSRHSVAYNLKKEGVNINVIQDVLGHGTVAMTEKYLKALDDEAIDKEINKLYE